MATVEGKGLHKAYGDTVIIQNIDLRVEDREFAVFVGPSGCGKSTLLRMIAGLEEISGGELRIDGELSNEVPPDKRGCAMVFQSYALYPHMTVADNMGFALRLAKVPKAERDKKVRDAAKILHLEPLLERTPKALSGGQRQRVAIGRAIVRNPKVFLFDEPLSNLDAALRVQMRIELTRLHEELDATMIYVTHDQVEAMTMATKIVVLQSGRIEQVGSPLELYHHPRNQFVAGFIGSPKMNFLAASVAAIEAGGALIALPGGEPVMVPVKTDGLAQGQKITLGVRPEHLQVGEAGQLKGEVLVAERLGGSTFLYAGVANQPTLTIEAHGENPARAHDRLSIQIDGGSCHLFTESGEAVPRALRHPMADMKRSIGRSAN
jgi:multiple sugar transport system ATP-binding protein